MKKLFIFLALSFFVLFGVLNFSKTEVYAASEYEHEIFDDETNTWTREVYTWADMDNAFQNVNTGNMTKYGIMHIKLMEDLSINSKSVSISEDMNIKSYSVGVYNKIEIDFNGHKLIGTDTEFYTYQNSKLQNFIKFHVFNGGKLIFNDTVGGGGIEYNSYIYKDTDVAALYIQGYEFEEEDDTKNSVVIFNGGTYKLTSECLKFGTGTLYYNNNYRGTVIVDTCKSYVNDGNFIAKSNGVESNGTDYAARELAAFATIKANPSDYEYVSKSDFVPKCTKGNTFINGGCFESDGYSIHHFDFTFLLMTYGIVDSYTMPLDSSFWVYYPQISGGMFRGQMGFTGQTFIYSDGYEEWNNKPASDMFAEDVSVKIKLKSGKIVSSLEGLDFDDLHDCQSCIALSNVDVTFDTNASLSEDQSEFNLTRIENQKETFSISYQEKYWLNLLGANYNTLIQVKKKNSTTSPKSYYNKSSIEVDYSEYKNGCEIDLYLFVNLNGEITTLTKTYDVNVKKIYKVTNMSTKVDINIFNYDTLQYETRDCFEVVEGEPFEFRAVINDNYEYTGTLKAYANDIELSRDSNAWYTIDNVTGDTNITFDESGFRGIVKVKYTYVMDGITGTAKTYYQSLGDTITVKSLDDVGFDLASGKTFSYWRCNNKKYNPGDEYTCNKVGEIEFVCQIAGLYNIEVINGKAYSDSDYQNEITEAAENTYVYIKADEPDDGKMFSFWYYSENGSYSNNLNNNQAAETYFMMQTSDVLIEAEYNTPIDRLEVSGVTMPIAGEAYVPNHDEYYTKWYEYSPEEYQDAYKFDMAYWYKDNTSTSLEDGDVFELGRTYIYKLYFRIMTNNNYELISDLKDIELVINGIDPEFYTISSVTKNDAGTYITYILEFVCPESTEHEVIVVNGNGSGAYEYNDTVEVTANEAEEGKRFKSWEADSTIEIVFGDLNSETIIFNMPNKDITLTATYEDITSAIYGVVTSFIADEKVTITLTDAENNIIGSSIEAAGNITEYIFGQLAAGDYKLTVTKASHESFEKSITLGYDDYELNVKMVSLCQNDPTLHEDINEDYICDICGEYLFEFVVENESKVYLFEAVEDTETNITNLIKCALENNGSIRLTIGSVEITLISDIVKLYDGESEVKITLNKYLTTDTNYLLAYEFIFTGIEYEGLANVTVTKDFGLKLNECAKLFKVVGDNTEAVVFEKKDNAYSFMANLNSHYKFVKDIILVTIKGVISCDEDGTITLELVNSANEVVYTTTLTGTNSNYEIKNVAFGEYTIRLTKEGYTTKEETINVDTDKEYSLNVELAKNQDSESNTNTSSNDTKPESKNNAGLVVGIIIGSIILVAAAGVGVFFVIKKKKK